MTRKDLSGFIRAAEHSSSLRRELKKCKDNQRIIDLASHYGFSIKPSDFEEDAILDKLEVWFKASKIAPIKNMY